MVHRVHSREEGIRETDKKNKKEKEEGRKKEGKEATKRKKHTWNDGIRDRFRRRKRRGKRKKQKEKKEDRKEIQMEESVTENPKSHEGKNRTILSSHEEQPRSKNCRSSRLPTFLCHAFLPFSLLSSLSRRIFLLLRVHSVDYSILLQLIHLSLSYNFFTLVLLWCHFQPRVCEEERASRFS